MVVGEGTRLRLWMCACVCGACIMCLRGHEPWLLHSLTFSLTRSLARHANAAPVERPTSLSQFSKPPVTTATSNAAVQRPTSELPTQYESVTVKCVLVRFCVPRAHACVRLVWGALSLAVCVCLCVCLCVCVFVCVWVGGWVCVRGWVGGRVKWLALSVVLFSRASHLGLQRPLCGSATLSSVVLSGVWV